EHGDKSILHAASRITLGYHKEVHHHQTVIHEAKSDGPARVGVLVLAAYFAFENREAIAAHGGQLVRSLGGALRRAGTWAQHRIDSGPAEALQIEEAKIVAP